MSAWPRLPAMVIAAAALAALPSCHGCKKGDPPAEVAAGLKIPVEIASKDALVIDAPLLDRTPPDFHEGERRAWKLKTLIGAAADAPGTVIEIEDGEGTRTVLTRVGEAREGREPVLAVNRMGEVRVALMLPDEPFPPFHGRGGNRGRGGDPTRIKEVRRIRLRAGDAPSPSPAASP